MAVNSVLSSAQKEQLVNNQDFKDQVSWALRDFAEYWSNDDDAFISQRIAEDGYKRWAKNWIWASRTKANVTISDVAQAPDDFGVLLKGMELWDDQVPFDIAVVIEYMVTENKFEELAILYVNSKTPTAVF